MWMFCKDDRCGWWDSLCRRLKVGGYKMIDVLSGFINTEGKNEKGKVFKYLDELDAFVLTDNGKK
jgi:hypothetical protein